MKKIIYIFICLIVNSCGDFNNSLPDSNNSNGNDYTGTDPFTAEELTNINSGTFDKRKLIMNLGINVISPAVERFYNDSISLHIKSRNLCLAYKLNHEASILEVEIKDLWKQTMESYHYLESMMVGPMSDNDYDLRYKLYSFSLTKTNTCSIDKEIVKLYENPNITYKESYNRVGLDALEYLYFSPAIPSCKRPRGNMSNWANLPEQNRKVSKCAYIQRTTSHLLNLSRNFKNSWHPNFGNLTKKIIEENVFGNLDQAINTFSDSLFYLDKDLKDYKLAMPLGMNEECSTATCPNSVEHISTNFSFDALYFNLLGFKALINGKDYMNSRSINGFGFDDYLKTVNATELANRMNANIDITLKNLNRLKGHDFKSISANLDKQKCLETTRDNRLVEVCAIYKDIKSISDDLKNDFLVYLALKAPRQAQGDND
jgi:predicted lipoprotein